MIKRTVYIGNPCRLRCTASQLTIQELKDKEMKGSVPIEDMALLVLDNPRVSISSALLQKLAEHTVAVVVCDASHLPNGLMLPLQGHSELTQRWRTQLGASLPLKKQLWKQSVQAKIRNQTLLLKSNSKYYKPMEAYASQVQSGDESNAEGQAANHYWKYILENFKRERDGEPPNNMLNFGYAILRSIVARALVSSGMLPAVGIFHSNKYNPYCLADDVMEPYRPFVDALVVEWLKKNRKQEMLSLDAKAHLFKLLTEDVLLANKKRPLMVAISSTTSSLYDCFAGKRKKISYPVYASRTD